MNRGSSSLLSLFQQETVPPTTIPSNSQEESTEMSNLHPSTQLQPTLDPAGPGLDDMATRQIATTATTITVASTADSQKEEFPSTNTIVDMSQSASFESSEEGGPGSFSSLSLQDSIQCLGKSSSNHPLSSLRHSQSQGFGQQQSYVTSAAKHPSPAHLQHMVERAELQDDISQHEEDQHDIKAAVKEFKLQSNLSLYYEVDRIKSYLSP